MRLLLSSVLAALALGTGLATAWVACENRARAQALDALHARCVVLESVQGARVADLLERDLSPPPPKEDEVDPAARPREVLQ